MQEGKKREKRDGVGTLGKYIYPPLEIQKKIVRESCIPVSGTPTSPSTAAGPPAP